jgi:hypothetical protein
MVLRVPAGDPTAFISRGVIGLESGGLNLVAARLDLDRVHESRLVYGQQSR